MKTTNNLILKMTIWGALGTAACGAKTAAPHNSAVQPANQTAVVTNQPAAKTMADDQPETVKSAADNSLATPTEAYKTAFAARQKKDVDGLKKVLSKRMLDFFTELGKDEKKTLDDELKELAATPQAANAEARNEKITSDKATLEFLDANGKWKPMDFVKENGQWKLTLPAAPPAPVIENTTRK